MADDNTIIIKGDNSQLLKRLVEIDAALDQNRKSLEAEGKTAKAVEKELKSLTSERIKILKELDRQEQQARKQREREAKEAAAAEKVRQKELSQQRKAAAAEAAAINKQAAADFTRLAAAQEKLIPAAQAYLKQLQQWKTALAERGITQDQFNALRDAELAKLNSLAQAEKQEAAQAAAIEAQKKKNIQERLKFEQIAAAERAAIAKRDQAAADAQKTKNVEALKRLSQIRESEQAHANARKKAQEEELRQQKDLKKIEEERASSAKKVYEETRTPAERYRAQLDQIRTQYKRGEIDAETYRRKLSQLKEEFRTSSKSNAGAAELLTGKLVALGTSLITLPALFAAVTAENRKFEESLARTNFQLDEQIRKLAVQAGIKEQQLVHEQKKILDIAFQNAEKPDIATRAATELESFGFPKPQDSGALDAFLKLQASGNMKGMAPEQSIQGMSAFLQSYGLDRNGANMLDLGMRFSGIKDTATQFTDLPEIAKIAPVASAAGITPADLISAYAVVNESLPAGEASTGVGNTIQSLQTVRASSKKVKALKELGLKPGDVDLIGETLQEAMAKLNVAMEAVAPEKRATVMANLFGKEKTNASSAQLLMQKSADIGRLTQAQEAGAATFVNSVNVAQSGPNATANRLEVQRQERALRVKESATRIENQKTQLNNMDEAGYQSTGLLGDAGRWLSNTLVRDPLIAAGVDRENFFSRPAQRGFESASRGSQFSVEKLQELQQKGNQLQEQILEQLKANAAKSEQTAQGVAAKTVTAIKDIKPAPPAKENPIFKQDRGNR